MSCQFVIKVTYRQHVAAATAGHIIAFVQKPAPGKNAHRLDNGQNASRTAARFDDPESAQAAIDSLPDSPNRIAYEVLPENELEARLNSIQQNWTPAQQQVH